MLRKKSSLRKNSGNAKKKSADAGNANAVRRRGGRKSASITKSGEESSYMIPVGMTIAGLSGRSTDYSGITVGTILTLTVSEDGTVRAASAE